MAKQYVVTGSSASSGGGSVSSVFGRTGAVVAVSGDYAASEITNDSGVAGADVAAALDQLESEIAGAGAVSSVFGRTGAVTAQSGDYTVAQVTGAVPDTRTITAGSGLTGGGDLSANRTLAADFGTGAGKVTQGNDSRLSDARTPTAHASTHLPGGTDALTTAAPAQGIGGGNSVGTAASFARSDHDHKLRETGGPTDLTIGAVADGQAVKRSGSTLIGVTAASGSSSVWSVDVVPASPSAYDDECNGANGSSISGVWSDWNPGSATTAYTINGRGAMEVTQTTHSGTQLEGKYQTAPGTEFAFAAKFSFLLPTPSATFVGGIFVSDNIASSPTTAEVTFLNLEPTALGTTFVAAFQRFTSYNAFNSNLGVMNVGGNCSGGGYLRIRVNGNVVSADFGWPINGEISWALVAAATIGYTLSKFGFAVNNANSGNSDQVMLMHWFRLIGSGAGSSGFSAASAIGGWL